MALLEDNIMVEEIGVDGPGCGLGNDVPVNDTFKKKK